MTQTRIILGEALGGFLLIAIGCGAGAAATIAGGAPLAVMALAWGLAVAIAVHAARPFSDAHLNPVFTLVALLRRQMPGAQAPAYLGGQFLGTFLGAVAVALLFGSGIAAFEAEHGLVRGAAASVKTAAIFTVFFPSPGGVAALTPVAAFVAEAVATFALVALALMATDAASPVKLPTALGPSAVGAVVAVLILTVAPLTGTGLNPAREFGPRLFVWLAGWGPAAWAHDGAGGLIVYWLAPLLGGTMAGLMVARLFALKRA